ncbi:MAG TPA: hypothetical protein VFU14_08775 [Acidimicrobiales bacterium]|nr:hypothetical protein [Acidimicrobiales bacterium]
MQQAPAQRSGSVPRGFWAVCVGLFLIGFGLRIVVDSAAEPGGDDGTPAHVLLELLRADGQAPRTVSVYGGLGVWVDAFDFSPSYLGDADAPVTPDVVEEWASLGVRTVYLQASRPDDRSPGTLLEEDLLAEFLLRAHAADLLVVGWYLPTFADVDADLERLLAVAEFEALGHRFDGVAVDIEYIESVPDPDERSARLVDLSTRLRAARPGEALGAIVPPAVQLEVVNTTYWPRFPWRALDASYDVWLPMAYWTTRDGTPYGDAYRYSEESTRRMRANIGRQDAVVHLVGGIGDATTPDDLEAFRRAVDDTGAIGASLYDWASLPPDQRAATPTLLPG